MFAAADNIPTWRDAIFICCLILFTHTDFKVNCGWCFQQRLILCQLYSSVGGSPQIEAHIIFPQSRASVVVLWYFVSSLCIWGLCILHLVYIGTSTLVDVFLDLCFPNST